MKKITKMKPLKDTKLGKDINKLLFKKSYQCYGCKKMASIAQALSNRWATFMGLRLRVFEDKSDLVDETQPVHFCSEVCFMKYFINTFGEHLVFENQYEFRPIHDFEEQEKLCEKQ